jgi:transcription elongation GreA/GreB family factor
MTTLTKEIHRFLELHTLELQNSKISIANRYLTDYEKYIKVLNFLNSYIGTIEKYIDKAGIEAGEHSAPFVIIGSTVEVEDLATQKKHTVMVEKPDADYATAGPDSGCEYAPFLSAASLSLLFKETGQQLTLQDGEENEYTGRIERIDYNLNL